MDGASRFPRSQYPPRSNFNPNNSRERQHVRPQHGFPRTGPYNIPQMPPPHLAPPPPPNFGPPVKDSTQGFHAPPQNPPYQLGTNNVAQDFSKPPPMRHNLNTGTLMPDHFSGLPPPPVGNFHGPPPPGFSANQESKLHEGNKLSDASHYHQPGISRPSFNMPPPGMNTTQPDFNNPPPGFNNLPTNFGMPPPGHISQTPPMNPPASGHSVPPQISKDRQVDNETEQLDPQSKTEKYQERLRQLLQEVQKDKEIKITQRNTDQSWVETFVDSRKSKAGKINGSTVAGKQMTVAEYRAMLRQSLMLQREMRIIHSELAQNKSSMDQDAWTEKMASIQQIKDTLQALKEALTNETTFAHIQKRLKVIQHKKARLKRVREERVEEDEREEERINALHQKMDRWQDQHKEKQLQLKREKELKANADKTLAEVRRKLSDVIRNQQVLKALQKLRKIREQNLNKQGQYTSRSVDAAFVERVGLMNTVLEQRVREYEAEQKMLEVMLETEQEENEEKEREQKTAIYEKKVQQLRQETEVYLFGEHEPLDPSDPLYKFRNSYQLAERSLTDFVDVRKAWDVHLVADNDPDGSSVPVGWVEPSAPADRRWATALLPPQEDKS